MTARRASLRKQATPATELSGESTQQSQSSNGARTRGNDGTGGNNKKRPRHGGGGQGASRRGPKTKEFLNKQLLENVARASRDPYCLNDPERYPRCNLRDHARKKNCADNPRCLFGLGEGREGIWTTNPRIVLTLGEDVSGSLRSPADFEEQAPGSDGSGKPTASRTGDGSVTTPVRGRLPAGLKNLGATCYLNSQLQALFANRAFRAGVYSWRSCSPRGSAARTATKNCRTLSTPLRTSASSSSSADRKIAPVAVESSPKVVARSADKVADTVDISEKGTISAAGVSESSEVQGAATAAVENDQSSEKSACEGSSGEIRAVSENGGMPSRGIVREENSMAESQDLAAGAASTVGEKQKEEEMQGKETEQRYSSSSSSSSIRPRSKISQEISAAGRKVDCTRSAPINSAPERKAPPRRDRGGELEGADVGMAEVVEVDGGVAGSAEEFCGAGEGARNDDKIMEELQSVFGHMQAGRAKVYDPARFANLLGIDNGIQQDPQEFNKLLMSLLERCLQRSAPPLPGLVGDLFAGELAYVTRCLTCNNASKRTTPFNELELQIGENRTIEACLGGFLAQESLSGDNQYLCEQCSQKRDAVRYIELRRLPPVLSIQFLRYVYDFRTGIRKKIKAPISLAPTLDMGPRLRPQGGEEGEACAAGAEESVYELGCVLYHKGSSVHSGHYVAEVRDPRTNTWTLFDDEKVTPVEGVNSRGSDTGANGGDAGASGEGSTKVKGKEKAKGARLKKRGRPRGREATVAATESDSDASVLAEGEVSDEDPSASDADGGDESSSSSCPSSVAAEDQVQQGQQQREQRAEEGAEEEEEEEFKDDTAAKDNGKSRGKRNVRSLAGGGEGGGRGGARGKTGAKGAEGQRNGKRRRINRVVEPVSADDEDEKSDTAEGKGGGSRSNAEASTSVTVATTNTTSAARGSGTSNRARGSTVANTSLFAAKKEEQRPRDSGFGGSGGKGDQKSRKSGPKRSNGRVRGRAKRDGNGDDHHDGNGDSNGKNNDDDDYDDEENQGGGGGGGGCSETMMLVSDDDDKGGSDKEEKKEERGGKDGRGRGGGKGSRGGGSRSRGGSGVAEKSGTTSSNSSDVKSEGKGEGDDEAVFDSADVTDKAEGGGRGRGSSNHGGDSDDDDDEEEEEDNDEVVSLGNGSSGGGANRGKGSEDAYMLIYVRKGYRWGAASGGEDEPVLPAHIQAAVDASNAALALEVSRFEQQKRVLEADMQARRTRYATLFGRPPNFTSSGERKDAKNNTKVAKVKTDRAKKNADVPAGTGPAVTEDGDKDSDGKSGSGSAASPDAEGAGRRAAVVGRRGGGGGAGRDDVASRVRRSAGDPSTMDLDDDEVVAAVAGAKAAVEGRGGASGEGKERPPATTTTTAGSRVRDRPVVHPGPTDEQLRNAAASAIHTEDGYDEVIDDAASIAAAKLEFEIGSKEAQETRDLNHALAESLATTTTINGSIITPTSGLSSVSAACRGIGAGGGSSSGDSASQRKKKRMTAATTVMLLNDGAEKQQQQDSKGCSWAGGGGDDARNGMQSAVNSAGLTRASPRRGEEEGEQEEVPQAEQSLLESEFFWVDSHWLRQWVVGEHLPDLPSDTTSIDLASSGVSVETGSSSCGATAKDACLGKGTCSTDPLVLGVDGAVACDARQCQPPLPPPPSPSPPANHPCPPPPLQEQQQQQAAPAVTARCLEGGEGRSGGGGGGVVETVTDNRKRKANGNAAGVEAAEEAKNDQQIPESASTLKTEREAPKEAIRGGSGAAVAATLSPNVKGEEETGQAQRRGGKRLSPSRENETAARTTPLPPPPRGPSRRDRAVIGGTEQGKVVGGGLRNGMGRARQMPPPKGKVENDASGSDEWYADALSEPAGIENASPKRAAKGVGVTITGETSGENLIAAGGESSESVPETGPRNFAGKRPRDSRAFAGAVSVSATSVVRRDGVFRESMRHLPLACQHGGVDPTSVSRLKLVTRRVYEGLLGEEGMPPPDWHLAATNFRCEQCVKNHIGQKESNVAASILSGELVTELEKPEPVWPTKPAAGEEGGSGSGSVVEAEATPFVISRKWVADFKAYHDQFLRSAAKMQGAAGGGASGGRGAPGGAGKAKALTKPPPDARVNSNITCDHGKLTSSKRGVQKKYRYISARGWEMVLERFPQAAGRAYPAGTQPCTTCQEQDNDDIQLKIQRRNAKSMEMNSGPALKGLWRRGGTVFPQRLVKMRSYRVLSNSHAPVPSNDRFFLAESWWLDAWRNYHDSTSILQEPPTPLLNQGLRCVHGAAVMEPRLRQVLEGLIPASAGPREQGAHGGTGAEVLTEAEWRDLSRAYSVSDETSSRQVAATGDENPDAGAAARARSGSGIGDGVVTFEVSYSVSMGWAPGICEECMAAASDRADVERSVFQNKAVNVVRLKDGEAPPVPDPSTVALGIDAVPLSASGRPQRKTRGKGAGSGAPLSVNCCSDESIAVFKLKVFELTDVVPNRQKLFHAGVPLRGEVGDTLQLAGVKAGATLHLQVLESKGALLDDTHLYTEALSSKPPDGPEIGFAGTALAGTRRPSPPPCTLSSSGTGGVIEGSSPLSPFTIDGGVADPVEMDCPSCTATNDISGGCVTKCHVCGLDLFT